MNWPHQVQLAEVWQISESADQVTCHSGFYQEIYLLHIITICNNVKFIITNYEEYSYMQQYMKLKLRKNKIAHSFENVPHKTPMKVDTAICLHLQAMK